MLPDWTTEQWACVTAIAVGVVGFAIAVAFPSDRKPRWVRRAFRWLENRIW